MDMFIKKQELSEREDIVDAFVNNFMKLVAEGRDRTDIIIYLTQSITKSEIIKYDNLAACFTIAIAKLAKERMTTK